MGTHGTWTRHRRPSSPAKHPTALARRTRNTRESDFVPSNYEELGWLQERGPTAFAPFPAETEYFETAQNQWMINFRLGSLDCAATCSRVRRCPGNRVVRAFSSSVVGRGAWVASRATSKIAPGALSSRNKSQFRRSARSRSDLRLAKRSCLRKVE